MKHVKYRYQPHTLYFLLDPNTKEIVYVGVTRQPVGRKSQHKSKGFLFQPVYTYSREEAYEAEKICISKLTELEIPLLNRNKRKS